MSMEIIKVSATRRQDAGKGPSNRLRRAGQIPAVAYGKDLAPVQVAVSPKDLVKILQSDHGKNSVVELAIAGGDKLTVMVRDYDYHPISRELVHADFLQVKLDHPVDVQVPFRLTGKAKGTVLGGIVQQIFRTIPIRSLPEKIPSVVELDITELDMGESLKASQLHLPEGVKALIPDDQTVVVCNAPEKGGAEEAAPGAAAAPGGEKAAAAAKAPAAAEKAPAKKK
jgi:large subunit ribosomal protein L25